MIDSDFRIFIDAATLKADARIAQNNALKPDFRIFIDAATLKDVALRTIEKALSKFPHLYICGHIEGWNMTRSTSKRFYFRIFIDAATLKARLRSRSTSSR